MLFLGPCQLIYSEAFYFLHIPKTAGTTFCFSILPHFFEPSAICPAHDYPELLPMLSDLGKYRLFRGHFYHYFAHLLPARPIFMTFLRDPVERVLSHYDHICRDPTHYHHGMTTAFRNGLLDAVRSPGILPGNFQVTSLARDIDPIRTLESARERHSNKLDEYAVTFCEMIKTALTQRDLQTACRRLAEMEFVGIVEHFDESIALLSKTFGWPVPSYQRLNVAPKRTRRAEIAPEVLREIIKANELDFELYEFGKSLFLTRYEDHATPLTARPAASGV
jgi:hypothetical protein